MSLTILFLILLFIVAFLYASVGHGGASGYLALMALFSMSPAVMRPTALLLNLFVSLSAFILFYRGGHFKWKIFLPFALASIPCSFIAVPPQADGGSGTDADPPAAQAEVGGADDEGKGFVDWSVGPNTPPIIRGPQGGQHIWVSAHARHVYPNKARVAVTMYLDEGGTAKVVSPGRVEMIGMLKGDGDWLIYPGIAAFVKEPCKIYGKNVRVELEVDDLYGRRATDTKWIRPTWDGPCD